MKPTDKNSPLNEKNKSGDDTLLYVLLLILIAILIGGLTWWYFWPKDKWQHDYESALGKKKISPTADDVSKLIQNNKSRLKTAKRILADKMRGRKLTDKEKNEAKKELENINRGWEKALQSVKIEDIEKQNPAMLASIYSDLYEQGKVTVRLKDKTAVRRSLEELKKQQAIQSRWDIPTQEVEEITAEMKKWIEKWYRQAEAELIGSEPGKYPRLTEYVVPWYEKGQKIETPSQEQINKFKGVQDITVKEGRRVIEKKVDFSKPLSIEFKGYYGFLTEEDKKGSGEGQETYGVTKSTRVNTIGGSRIRKNIELDEKFEPIGWIPSDYNLTKVIGDNYRDIVIGFEKNMFFNRLGYEEWITEVYEKDNSSGRIYFDICFEECVGTMAHELAHAIVNTIEAEYKGEEGGGHGKLFYEIMKKIKKMIKTSPEFKDFKAWWEKPEMEQKELAIGSILITKQSHWDQWKYWYIGGGAIIIILGFGLVIVFWDSSTGSKKNAKN